MHLLDGTMLNMSIHLAACGRLPGRWASSGRLGGPASHRALCTPAAAVTAGRARTEAAAAAVVVGGVGQAEGGKGSESRSKEQTGGKKSAGVRAFREIPHTGRSGWLNLLRFWKEGRFTLLHKHMESTFNTLGPIYR